MTKPTDDAFDGKRLYDILMVGDAINIDPGIQGGVPCIKGTNVPVYRALNALAEDDELALGDVEYDLYLPEGSLVRLINALARFFGNPGDVP